MRKIYKIENDGCLKFLYICNKNSLQRNQNLIENDLHISTT